MTLETQNEPLPIKAEVRQLRESDIFYLEPILREHVRDSATKQIIEPEVQMR
jgi:hypothetical protein